MQRPDYIPENYDAVKVVGSLTELFNEPFGDSNCILFPRPISGQFNELARVLHTYGRDKLEDNDFLPVLLRSEKRLVMDDIYNIGKALDSMGMAAGVILRITTSESWNELISPDAFHVDGCSRVELGRILCCYNTPVTEWLRNDEAIKRMSGLYRAKPDATIRRFRPGDIFRIKSTPNNGFMTPGESCFIHRAPKPNNEQERMQPRMLLVAG